MVYKVSSRIAKATEKNPVSKKKKKTHKTTIIIIILALRGTGKRGTKIRTPPFQST